MELKPKLPNSNELQIVKPYWIARNTVCRFPHQGCCGIHGLKLPQLKQYLKKGHFKMFTEESMKEYMRFSWEEMQGVGCGDRGGVERKDIEEFLRAKGWNGYEKNISVFEDKENQCGGLRKYNSQRKVGRVSRRGESWGELEYLKNQDSMKYGGHQFSNHYHQSYSNRYQNQSDNKYENRYSKWNQNSYRNGDYQDINQSRRKNDSKIFPPIYANPSPFYERSPQFSPLLSDHQIEQLKNQQSHLLHPSNSHHPNNNTSATKNLSFNAKKLSKLKRLPTQHLLKQQRFSSFNHTPSNQLQHPATSLHHNLLPHQDKTMLLQQLSQTIKIIQATISKKERISIVNSKKIMNLFGMTEILKGELRQQEVRVGWEQYVGQEYLGMVKEIQKVLKKSQEYKEIVKELGEKWRARDIVAKKVVGTEREKMKGWRRQREGQGNKSEEENGGEEKQEYLKKKSVNFKKHQRYKSDNVLLQNLRKQQANLSRIQLQKQRLLNKKFTLNQPNFNPTQFSKLKSGFKSSLNQKGKLPKSFMKNQLKPKKPKQISSILFDQQKLQKIFQSNKRKSKRPGSTRANRDSLIEKKRSIQKFQSEKLLTEGKGGGRRQLRVSFLKMLKVEKTKSKAKGKSSEGQSKNISKIVSQNTTPPPDLIQEIDDGEEIENQNGRDLELPNQNNHKGETDRQSRDKENINFSYKMKNKARFNHFQLNDYHEVDIPSGSQYSQDESESQPEDTLNANRKRKSHKQQNQDWSQIIKGVPKKRTHKINIDKRISKKRKTQKMVAQLNSRYMVNLRSQVYSILDNRIPQFQSLRQILLQGQAKLQQLKLAESLSPLQSQHIEQPWISGLDFSITIHTNHRQHVGIIKGPRILVRHDPDTDPTDLYEIAARESHVVERLQEKERLLVFAKESLVLRQQGQDVRETMSYAF